MHKAIAKISIALSLAGLVYAAPSKAQEHAVSTGVTQSEVKGKKPVKEAITSKEHKGAKVACGKDLKCPPRVN